MPRLRSSCFTCGGTVVPTGQIQTRADAKEYAAFYCHACGATQWEPSVDHIPVLLMQEMIPHVFVLCGFIGGLCLVLALVSMLIVMKDGLPVGGPLFFLFLGCVIIAFGFRPRTVKRYPGSGDVVIAWGKHFPWVYEHFEKKVWKTFTIEKFFLHYQLDGLTKRGLRVCLFRSLNLEKTQAWGQVFADASGVDCVLNIRE